MAKMSEAEMVAHFNRMTIADLKGYAFHQLAASSITRLNRKGELVRAIVKFLQDKQEGE